MTRILIRDLQPSSRYMLQLRAVGADGSTSQWSRTFTLDTIADAEPPSPVTGLTVQSTGDSFVAQWTKPTTSSGGGPLLDFKHFAVTVSSSLFPGTTRTLITSSDEFSLTFEHNVSIFGAPAGTVTISVAAVDTTGNASSSVSATASNPPPSPVTGLTAESVTDGIGLTWDANNTDIDLKHYEVWLSTTGASGTYTKVMETSATSVIHTTNMYTTDHWYRVYSVDKFNTPSSPTQTTSAVRPKSPFAVDTTAPGMPTSLSASIVTNYPRADLLVSWTNPANPDNDLSHVTVAYRPVGETNWSFTNVDYTDTSVRIEGVQLYKNYEVKVAASDWSSNRSAYTAVVTTSTASTNSAPATVTGVAISAGADSVNVSWNANSEPDVANGAGTYLVNIATNSGFTTGLLQYRTGATSIAITGLAQGQIYYARVKAVDSAGMESASWSSTVNATTGTISTFKYTTSPTAPSVKNEGDIWFDESTGFEKQWKSGAWVNTGNASIQYVTGQTNTLVKNYVTEYAVNSSESTPPSSGWSTSTPTRTPGTFIWHRVKVTYGDNTTSTTSPALLTGNTGAPGSDGPPGIPGEPGADGATYYTWLKYADTPTTGMSDSPSGKTYMGIAVNKTSPTESSNYADYTWSLIKGADGAAGKGISSTVVNYAKSTDGVNAPGSGWGTSIPSTSAGEFLWTRTVTTYTDASSSTAYSVAAHGTTGSPGTPGVGISGTEVRYQVHSNGTTAPTGTWLSSVPATSAGQFLWTRTVTSYTSGSPTTAYSVAAHGATGQQGIPGNPGADGATTYTWVKYADNSSGGGMSDLPAGKTYIGLAFNKTTQTESTTPGDYQWSLIQGPQGNPGSPGSPGDDGVSVTSITPYFRTTTTGASAPDKPTTSPPAAPWTATEPSYAANTELWRTERVTFSNSTFAYTDVTKVASYEAATIAISAANDKNKIVHSTGTPGSTPNTLGDTWVRYDGSNQIIAQWRGNGGTSWTQESISSQFIANLDAGKLTANSAFINTLNIGSGGAIQSAGYTSGGSSGFRLSNTGLVIKGTGNSVAVESIAAGTISAKTINIGATGTLNIDSTGQVKSNNYSSGSTGYRLSSSGLEVNDGVIDAKTLKTGSAFVTELTIGQSANNNGSLKSFGYSAGTTGWKLDKSGLEINNGDIAASALRLNSSPNLVPVQYADFEWDTFWYKSAFWSSGKGKDGIAESAIINGIVADPNTGKQSLGFSAFSSTAGWFALGLSNTDYNIALNDAGRYIFSFYAKNIASAADTWNVQIKGNNGNIIASQVIVLPANMTAFQRYSFAFDRPASGVVACVPIFNRTSTTHVTLVRFDSVQMELRTGNTDEPSIWKPPGTTMINGYGISTGEIRSTAYVSVNGTEYPSWSMNVNGNMQVSNALIRGKLLVGLAGDPDAGGSYIASGNYAANTSGWKIDSAGNAELNNGLFRGTITASYITGTTQITSGEIIAGNVLSRYSRVTGEGFQVLTIGAEGEANLELSLGSSDHSDMLILKRADGTISVSADNEGRLSAGTVSSDEDVMVGGIPLLGTNLTFEPDVGVGALYTGHIDKLPRGVIASAKFKGGGPWANGNMYINELTFDAHPGRHYRVVFSGAMGYARPGINPRGFYLGIATPSSPGGDAYGQSPSIQGYSYVQSADPNRAVTFPPLIFHLRCNKGGKAAGGELNAGTNRLLLGVNASGTGHEVEVHGSQEWSYFVEDIGPDLPSISTSKPWVSGGSGGGTAPPKKTYTTRWYANGYRVYKGDGSDRTSNASPDMIQGYSPYAPSNGDNYTQMLFTGNSFYGQTGITISTAMSGATLRYAYIYLYASHWNYGSGGTGIIRTSTNTSLTSSVPSSTSVQQSGWGAGQGKKINISSIFATNHRSVWLGKSGGTNPLYYGRFSGPNVSTTSQRPYLELVYEK